jgi:hypothetical protein
VDAAYFGEVVLHSLTPADNNRDRFEQRDVVMSQE